MDVKTGAVLAMASSPTYNPNLVAKPGGYARIVKIKGTCGDHTALQNNATAGLYPPGSTFKIVTAAAALESGKFTPDSTFSDPGYCTEYGKPVYNAGNADADGPESFGSLNLVTAFEHSVNSVFCNIGKTLGAAKVLEQAKKFGFYSTPPLETPSDARSGSGLYVKHRLYNPKDPNAQVDPGRLAFGQERMLVTPLQMAMVAAAIGNGGVVMQPYVVDRILKPGGGVLQTTKPKRRGRAISPQTAAELTTMMESVVTGGTGTAAQIPGVRVAGKTGTAETSKPGVNTAWFVAFAPADNPRYAVAVALENQLHKTGGEVAAPIAKTVMEALLRQTTP
jgi:peptidoglycan glycosyltransferase